MVQKGTINVLIIRPRHKINIADNSILFSPLNMSEFVSSGTTTWKTALKIIRTKCQACQNWHIQIWHQNWIWNCGLVNKQRPPCSHQARGQTPNTIPLSKNATIFRSAPPCMAVNKIYLGFSLPDQNEKSNLQMSLVDNENCDVAVSCSPEPDVSLSLIATRTQRSDRQTCDCHPRHSDSIKGTIDD